MNEQEIRDFFAGDSNRTIKKVKFPQLQPAGDDGRMKLGINYLDNVPVTISAELGTASIKVRDLLSLEEGSVLELERPAGEVVDIYLNQQRFGQAEVVIIGDNFGLRVYRIFEPGKAAGENENG